MADPLSLIASIIAIIGVGGQVTKAVRKIASLKDAPDVILALNNEISDFHLVILAIEDVFQRQRNSRVPPPSGATAEIYVDITVANSLQFAKGKTDELEALYLRLTPSISDSSRSSKVNRLMWSRMQKTAKTAWLKEQRRVKRMQEDLRSARLKLTAALGVLNSSSLQLLQEGMQATQNAIRDLKEIQQPTETAQVQRPTSQQCQCATQYLQNKPGSLQLLQQINDTRQSRRSVDRETALQEPILQSQVCQQQVALKLDSIENKLTTNMEPQSKAMMQSIFNPWAQSNIKWTSDAIRVTATVVNSHVASTCSCSCHNKRRPTKRTPNILNRFIGVLFIGYHGVPYVNEPCDDADCGQRCGSEIRLAYLFPAWLLARTLTILFKLSPARGPEFIIRLPRTISNVSRIITSAIKGNVNDMREILNKGLGSPMDVDISNGCTPLIFLLHAGADPYAEDKLSRNCFELCWTYMLSNQADESTRARLWDLFPSQSFLDDSEFSLLHRVILSLSPLRLDTLLENLSRSEIDQVDSRGRTALLWAARRGDLSAVSQLLGSGADPNKNTYEGNCPLSVAIQSRNQSCISAVLRYGAEIHRVNSEGWSPLHQSCYYGSDIDIVKVLLGGGVGIEDRIPQSDGTPLMLAAQEGHLLIVKYLISEGANLDATNSDGETALLIAVSENHSETAGVLLNEGAECSPKTRAGESLLHYAAQFADLACLKVLHASDLACIDLEDKIVAMSPIQRMKDIKGLTALQIAEKRSDVTNEWKDLFQEIIRSIQQPERKIPMTDSDEDDEFKDTLWDVDERRAGSICHPCPTVGESFSIEENVLAREVGV